MARLRLAALAALALIGGARAQDTDWPAVWDELDALVAAPEAPGADVEFAKLALVAAREGAHARGRLLAAWIERAQGRELALELGAQELDALSPRESWLAARALAPGASQERALERALEGLPAEQVTAVYQPAWERFVALSGAFEQERALRLAQALHARARAPWSAVNLASTLRRAGRYEEAWALLDEQLARAGEDAERAQLLQDRALVDAGAGWVARERADLGAALARGSSDAAVVLGRQALAAGRPERARALFRSVLREDPPQPWALRGWGLSMLPRARGGL